MNNATRALMTALAVVSAFGPDTDSEAGESPSEAPPVFAYGRQLEPPFEFSTGENDTLLLNGYPYSPFRQDLAAITSWRPPSDEEREDPELLRRGEIIARLTEEGRRRVQHIEETDELLEQALAFFRSAPEVKSARRIGGPNGSIIVELHAGGVTCAFSTLNLRPRTLTPLSNPSPSVEESFWSLHGKGCLVAFGEGYRITIAPDRVPETLQILEAMGHGPVELPKRTTEEYQKFLAEVQRENQR